MYHMKIDLKPPGLGSGTVRIHVKFHVFWWYYYLQRMEFDKFHDGAKSALRFITGRFWYSMRRLRRKRKMAPQLEEWHSENLRRI